MESDRTRALDRVEEEPESELGFALRFEFGFEFEASDVDGLPANGPRQPADASNNA
jgi:hypothetical protein